MITDSNVLCKGDAMMKKFCGFLFLGALIVGCSCDIQCFIDKQRQRVPLEIESITTNDFCRAMKQSYDDVRSDVKECSLTKINVDKLEAFTNEICFENGTLHKVALKHQDCLKTQSGKALECLATAGIQVKLEDLDKPLELMKSVCEKIDKIYSCINSKFAEVCEEEAAKLIQNATTAFSTYTSGLCLEINGASLNQVVYMNIFLGLLCVLLMWHKD